MKFDDEYRERKARCLRHLLKIQMAGEEEQTFTVHDRDGKTTTYEVRNGRPVRVSERSV